MLRKVILNLKHFTSWFIKGEKKNPNQTKQPQKPVCYFSITIIQRPRTLGPTKSWNSLKAVPKKTGVWCTKQDFMFSLDFG